MLSDCIHYTLSETQFNIIHILRRNRFRFRAATQHFAAMRRLTPPLAKTAGVQMRRSIPRIHEKKFPTLPRHEVLT